MHHPFSAIFATCALLATGVTCAGKATRRLELEKLEQRACVIVTPNTVECRSLNGSSWTRTLNENVVSIASTQGGICILDAAGSVALFSPSDGGVPHVILEHPEFSQVFGFPDGECCATGRLTACSSWQTAPGDWERWKNFPDNRHDNGGTRVRIKSTFTYMAVSANAPLDIDPTLADAFSPEWVAHIDRVENIVLRNAILVACRETDDKDEVCKHGPEEFSKISEATKKIVFGMDATCVLGHDGTLFCLGPNASHGVYRRGGIADFDIDGSMMCVVNTQQEVSCWDTRVVRSPPDVRSPPESHGSEVPARESWSRD